MTCLAKSTCRSFSLTQEITSDHIRLLLLAQVPLDLPPVTHAVRLFFTQGGSTFEALRYLGFFLEVFLWISERLVEICVYPDLCKMSFFGRVLFW